MIFRRKDRGRKNKPIVEDIISLWETSIEHDPMDILGSYTGTPNYDRGYDLDDDIVPEQDPDDL